MKYVLLILMSLMTVGWVSKADTAGPIKKTGVPKCVIGYGYSDILVPVERQEHFFMGFKYGLERALKELNNGAGRGGPCSEYERIEIIKDIKSNKGKLEALYAAQELASHGAVLLAGFPTSHEALLAAKIAKGKKLALVVPGAGVDALKDYGEFLFTTSPINSAYLDYQFSELVKRHKDILLVAKKDEVFSMDLFKHLQSINEAAGRPLNFIQVFLNEKSQIDDHELKSVLERGVTAVFITMYASESKQVLLQLLKNLLKDSIIYVSSAWSMGDLSYLSDVRSKFGNQILSVAVWSSTIGLGEQNSFTEKYRSIFKTYPPLEAAHGYEAGAAAANLLFNAKEATAESVLESLKNLGCFTVETVGRLCRSQTGFSERRFFWLKWTDNGFEVL